MEAHSKIDPQLLILEDGEAVAWYHYLWPFGRKHKERVAAERAATNEFQAQLREAVLRLDDLTLATERMKKLREDRTSGSMGRIRIPQESKP